jgi:ribosomal protein L1
MEATDILNAIAELRKEKKRKFTQTIDLIINLKNFDVKKQSVNTVVTLPHSVKERRVCAFLTKNSSFVDTITQTDFEKYKNKKELKKLIKKYDSFVSVVSLMPSVAVTFGKVLGPAGKMPSPQLGILPSEDEKVIKDLLGRINKIVKVKSKEASLKISIGKETLKDEEIKENILATYNAVFNVLPRQKENVKSVLIKFTMGKPIKIKL